VDRKTLNFDLFILVPFPRELVPLAGTGAVGHEHPDPTIRAGIEGILKRFREGQDAFRGTAKRFYEIIIYIAQWQTVFTMHELCSVRKVI
jgi:hypothetical protein